MGYTPRFSDSKFGARGEISRTRGSGDEAILSRFQNYLPGYDPMRQSTIVGAVVIVSPRVGQNVDFGSFESRLHLHASQRAPVRAAGISTSPYSNRQALTDYYAYVIVLSHSLSDAFRLRVLLITRKAEHGFFVSSPRECLRSVCVVSVTSVRRCTNMFLTEPSIRSVQG